MVSAIGNLSVSKGAYECSHRCKYKFMNGSNEPSFSRNDSHMRSKITMMVAKLFSIVNSLLVNCDKDVVGCGLSTFKAQPAQRL